jgi:hypothetical protein
MEKTYLAIVAILALATAAALTPVAISQQVFAQDTESETETENKAKNKCAVSGFSSCDQTATSTLTVTLP